MRLKELLVGVLILGAVVHAWSDRQVRIRDYDQRHEVETQAKVIQTFRDLEVAVVVSTDYWLTNQLTLASGRVPSFVSTGRPWGPPNGFELPLSEARVGVLSREPLETIKYRQRVFKLHGKTEIVPGLFAYVGQPSD